MRTRAQTLHDWQYSLTGVFATSGFALSTWFSRIPTIRDNLHATTMQMAVLLLGLSVGSFTGLALAPRMIGRWGTRRGLAVTLSATALGLLLVAITTDWSASFTGGCAALILVGAGNGSTDVLMNVEGARAEKAIGRTRLPLMHGFFSIGTIAGAALGALAATAGISVGVHLTVVAALTLGVAAIAIGHLPPARERAHVAVAPQRRHGADELTGRWFDLRLFVTGIILTGTAFAEGSGNDWIPLAVVDGHHFDNAAGSYAYVCFVLATTIGRLSGGALLDKHGRATVLGILAAVGALGVILVIECPGPTPVFLGTMLWGLGMSLGFPACIAAAADHRTHATERVSVVSVFGYASFLVGPPVIGFVGDHAGILTALWPVVAALIVTFVCTPAIRTRPRGAGQPATPPPS